GRTGAGGPGRAPGRARTCPDVPVAKMSVGGSTVVFVMRPTVIARAAGGHGYGEVPPARPGLTLVTSPAAEGPEAGASVTGLAQAGFAELEFAVIDLETTGWSPGVAAITEIAAVRVRGGRRQGEFASLVNPGVPVPPGIEDLTGISDGLLAAAPRLPAVLPGLLDFADGCVLVAHNAPFDVGFLRAACAECGLAWPRFTVLDTVMLARQLMDPDEVPDCKLGTLAGFFRARTAPSHRALADARATADVLGWLIRRLTHHGIRTLDQLRAWPEVVS
ncbi:MAG TPA: exonuclease domain-containing protein, partial [Streptosporangiaceae bacterium]|nr:exonuclease domain-containing protein [Streptosporangiaceae bacterium]